MSSCSLALVLGPVILPYIYNSLKVGSCPNDDNFVQIFFFVLFV